MELVNFTISLYMSTRNDGGLRLVITQPMLMPWHGLFSQILLADRVLIYDDVQLPTGGGSGRSFMTRVQIKTPNGVDWLSIPVQRSGYSNQRICDAKVCNTSWRKQHLAKIERSYSKAPFFQEILSNVVLPIYQNESSYLADFLIQSMKVIGGVLGVKTSFERSSLGDWANELSGTERLVKICRRLGASDYLSGNGGMNYLDYESFERNKIRVKHFSYRLRPYQQLHHGFTPYLSTIDLLFCVGPQFARDYLETIPIYWRDWPHNLDGRPVPFSP